VRRYCYGKADRPFELLVGNRLLRYSRDLADGDRLPVCTAPGRHRSTHPAWVDDARQYLVSCDLYCHSVLFLDQFSEALSGRRFGRARTRDFVCWTNSLVWSLKKLTSFVFLFQFKEHAFNTVARHDGGSHAHGHSEQWRRLTVAVSDATHINAGRTILKTSNRLQGL
jgi:hypothetical protein